MSFIKSFFARFSSKKSLSSILILFLLVPSVFFLVPPKKADAILGIGDIVHDPINYIVNGITAGATPVSAASNTISATNSTLTVLKNYVLRPIAWAIAQQMLQGITAQTVNWINTGFNGNPAYVTDPAQFFQNVGDQAVIQQLGGNGGLLNKLCTPFSPQIRLALVNNYIQQNQLGQCSISSVIKNYDAFTQNFENGGWEGWFSVTQNAQNNPYGAYLTAQDQLTQQIANQKQGYQKQLDYGQGFLSYQKCTDPIIGSQGSNGNVSVTYDELGQIQSVAGNTGYVSAGCKEYKTVTPGSIIKDSLSKTLGASVDKLNLVNDINQVANALLQQAFKSVVSGATGGLRGLSQPSSQGGQSTINQLLTDSQSFTSSTIKATESGTTLPSSIQDVIDNSSGTTPLTPTLDETALQAQITATANSITTGSTKNIPPEDVGYVGGTSTPTLPTASSCLGTVPLTITASNINSIGAYDALNHIYSPILSSKGYMVIYGSNFDPTCDSVVIGSTTYTPTQITPSQINVLLDGRVTGSTSVQVLTPRGVSNIVNVTINP